MDVSRTLSLESLSPFLLFECIPAPHSIVEATTSGRRGPTLLMSPDASLVSGVEARA
jgi:hypothetical protein